MRNRSILLTSFLSSAALFGLSLSAQAQQTNGFFIEGGGGANWVEDMNIFPSSFAFPGAEGSIGPIDLDPGWAASAQVGYGFGNGLILEAEATYRDNDGDLNVSGVELGEGGVPVSSFSRDYEVNLDSWAFMGNVIYEFDVVAGMHPYLGAGAGVAIIDTEVTTPGFGTFSDDDTVFAAQAMAGVRVPLTTQLSFVLDYRYFVGFDADFSSLGGLGDGLVPLTQEEDYVNHTVMAGLRYTFSPPPPEPILPLRPVAAPPAETAFIVFFDWDRADLTPQANLVLDDVVVVANQNGYAAVRLDGYTDLSGSPQYNLGLSERRANSVADALIARGIAPDEIVIRAFGEENPLVPTPDGVREPQNRRVEIFLS
ncbi:MAG: OmpA family protein [Pseudomonadota bacterium]